MVASTLYQQKQSSSQPQRRVVTPFGEGVVLRSSAIRNSNNNNNNNNNDDNNTSKHRMNEIQLTGWNAKLFSPQEFPSVPLQIGQDVLCQFGRGKIIDLRTDCYDQESSSSTTPSSPSSISSLSPSPTTTNTSISVAVVQLSSWRLAHRSRVMLYLQPKSITAVLRPLQPWEMSIVEKLEFAQHLKDTVANPLFQQSHDYAGAFAAYLQAVNAVKYIQHDAHSDNYVRADLIILMITCSNNAALCAMHLATSSSNSSNTTPTTTPTIPYWDQVYGLAQQALALLDALYDKRGLKIHSILTATNKQPSSSSASTTFTDAKLFGEWRVKSLVLMAKTLLNHKLDFDQAAVVLKRAHDIIVEYTTDTTDNDTTNTNNKESITQQATLQRQDKEVRRLLATVKERKRETKAKERKWAKAMFANTTTTTTSETTSTTTTKSVVNLNEVDEEEKKESATSSPTAANDAAMKATTARTTKTTNTTNEKKVSFAPNVSYHSPPSTRRNSHHKKGVQDGYEALHNHDDVDKEEENLDDNQDEDDEDDEVSSFLSEHEEALSILAVVGLAAVVGILVIIFNKRR